MTSELCVDRLTWHWVYQDDVCSIGDCNGERINKGDVFIELESDRDHRRSVNEGYWMLIVYAGGIGWIWVYDDSHLEVVA